MMRLTKLIQLLQCSAFFLINKHRYGNLEFRARLEKPLIVTGRKFITLKRGVIVKKRSSLFAIKTNTRNPELFIGEGSSIGHGNRIAAIQKVKIGKNVLTADNVFISDNSHEYEDPTIPIMHQAIKFKAEVKIGDGSWIGENACIIGAKIGKNCVVGANAVVTNDVPDYSVVAGVPAKIIRQYDDQKKKWIERSLK